MGNPSAGRPRPLVSSEAGPAVGGVPADTQEAGPDAGPAVDSGARGDHEHLRIGRVVRRWRVGTPRVTRRLVAGLMNLSWRVETDAGTYVLKRVGDVDRRALGEQHRVLRALAGAGLPVPVPLRTRDGDMHTVVDGERYVLQPWVAGRHRGGRELRLGECARLGARLADLHAVLSRLMPPVQQMCVVPTARVRDSLIKIEELLEIVRTRPDRDEFDDVVERRLLERGVLLSRLAEHRPPDVDTLTLGYVHGDFHSLNLLFDGSGELAAILDWDRLGIGAYARELVRAAVLLFVYADGHGLDLDRVRAFVSGYRDTGGLDGAQLRSAAHRMWWERANELWMLEWRYRRGDVPCGRLFPPAAALVAWWTEHRPAVTDAFAPG